MLCVWHRVHQKGIAGGVATLTYPWPQAEVDTP